MVSEAALLLTSEAAWMQARRLGWNKLPDLQAFAQLLNPRSVLEVQRGAFTMLYHLCWAASASSTLGLKPVGSGVLPSSTCTAYPDLLVR